MFAFWEKLTDYILLAVQIDIKMNSEKKEKKPDKQEIYIRNIFARNLRRLRGDRNLSQVDLASLSKLSPNYINEIENEKKWPSIETMAKLIKALSIEPFLLFKPEMMLKISDPEIFKMELSSSINVIVNEKVDRYVTDDRHRPDSGNRA